MKFRFILPGILSLFFSGHLHAEKINLHEELTPKVNNEQVEVRTYKHQDGAHITEYRSGGKVWMIKVQPVGNFPAYYLYDDDGEGLFEHRLLGNKQPSPPMWIIKKF